MSYNNGNRTEKISFRLTPEEKRLLEKVSAELDIPMAQIARMAIKKWMEERK